jgi:hypothetical protein
MAARRLKEELLNLALAEIDPPEQKNEACCKSINEALRLVDMVRVLDEAPAPGEFKKHVIQQGRAGCGRSGLCGYRGVRGRAVAWRTGACAQAGDLPAGADQTRRLLIRS